MCFESKGNGKNDNEKPFKLFIPNNNESISLEKFEQKLPRTDLNSIAIELAKEIIEQPPELVKDIIEQAPELVKQIVKQAPKLVKEIIGQSPDLTKETIEKLQVLIKEIVEQSPELFKEINVQSPESTKETIEKLQVLTKEIIEKLQEQAKEIIEKSVHINYLKAPNQVKRILPPTNCECLCDEYKLSYDELLKYQRMLNLTIYDEYDDDEYDDEEYDEGKLGKNCFFYRRSDSANKGFESNSGILVNKELLKTLIIYQIYDKDRPAEWDIVPDIYVLYPVKYPFDCNNGAKSDFHNLKEYLDKAKENLDKAKKNNSKKLIRGLIDNLEGRKKTETNIPALSINYLGKALCHIKSNYNNNEDLKKSLGNPVWVDFLFVWDQKSSSGVIILCSLSTPFLMSYLLDAVSNNDLIVQDEDADDVTNKYKKVEKYLEEKFKISIHGTAKSFVIIPQKADCLHPNQRAALLSSEAIMPRNLGYGHIIDNDIMAAVENNIGQYDRANVYAYSTVLLAFNEDLQCSVIKRIETESITLFYIILILMEEASICVANDEVVRLLSELKEEDRNNEVTDKTAFIKTSLLVTIKEFFKSVYEIMRKFIKGRDTTIEFLKRTDVILSGYAKTIDFWKAQLRFPTSQRSLDNIRSAFKVDDKLSVFKRNQQQLKTLFNTKSEIKDRISDIQTNEILFWLSVLAILSVINDSIDLVPKIFQLGEAFTADSINSMSRKITLGQLAIVVFILFKTGSLYFKNHKKY